MLKGQRSQLEGAPTGQIWDNMNIKINNNMNYILLNKIQIHELLLT